MEKFNFPHLHKLEFFWHKDVLCHVWLKWSSGPGEEDFWKLSMYFLCNYYLSLEKSMNFNLNTLNSL